MIFQNVIFENVIFGTQNVMIQNVIFQVEISHFQTHEFSKVSSMVILYGKFRSEPTLWIFFLVFQPGGNAGTAGVGSSSASNCPTHVTHCVEGKVQGLGLRV